MAREGAQPTEITQQKDFKDIVAERQRLWRLNMAPSLKTFSQGIDIPEQVSRLLLSTIVENLPPYVPPQTRICLMDHPNPIISVGVLADKRLFKVKDGLIPEHLPPEGIAETDMDSWERGMTLLDEMITDTLAQDIIEQMGKRKGNLAVNWFKPLSVALQKTNPIRKAYREGLEQAQNAFGGENEFEQFRQTLILSMLDGGRTSVDNQLKQIGIPSLDAFAVELGKVSGYGNGLTDLMADSESLTKIPEQIIEFGQRLIYSVAGGALISEMYPGVINLPTSLTLLASANAAGAAVGLTMLNTNNPVVALFGLGCTLFNAYWAVKPLYGIPNATIHEMVHYLAQDTTHNGLRQIKYKS